jgi:hypothetical protein
MHGVAPIGHTGMADQQVGERGDRKRRGRRPARGSPSTGGQPLEEHGRHHPGEHAGEHAGEPHPDRRPSAGKTML